MEATLLSYLEDTSVFLRQPDGKILHWTNACRQLYGFTLEEAQGHISHELLQTKFPDDLEAIERKLGESGVWSGRLRHTTKGGRSLWALAVWRLREAHDPAGPVVIEQITDITDAVQIEEQRMLLARELEHRVKNLLTVVQSLAWSSFPDAPPEQKSRFDNRLLALAHANQLLRDASWDEARLIDVVNEIANALGLDRRLQFSGPDVTIVSEHVMGFALAIHELCTNALKHGAFSVPQGIASVVWDVDPDERDRVRVRWQERGGPSPVPPTKLGFGTRLIERAIAGQLGAPAMLSFDPEGVVCELSLGISQSSHERLDKM